MVVDRGRLLAVGCWLSLITVRLLFAACGPRSCSLFVGCWLFVCLVVCLLVWLVAVVGDVLVIVLL